MIPEKTFFGPKKSKIITSDPVLCRLVSELTSLQRQSSGSALIAENLKKFQMQMEKSDSEDKRRLQVTASNPPTPSIP
jgi:hypothetical protein